MYEIWNHRATVYYYDCTNSDRMCIWNLVIHADNMNNYDW